MKTIVLGLLALSFLLLASCGGGGSSAPAVDYSPIVGVYHCTVVASSGPSPYPWSAGDQFDATVTDDGHLHVGAYDVQLSPQSGGTWQGGPAGPLGTMWHLDTVGHQIQSGIPGNASAGLVLTYTLPLG